jgi:pectate lyase
VRPRSSLAAGLSLFVLLAFVAGPWACADLRVDPFARLDASHDAGGPDGAGGTDGGADVKDAGDSGVTIVCPKDMVGFATLGGSTTGGGNAAPVTVTTLADLTTNAARTEPAVIIIKGTIVIPAASEGVQVPVESNKTILGADPQSGLTGGGLLINGKENVIVQNLTIALAAHTDAITVMASRRIWIDHCDLSSDIDHSSGFYDGLVDITHASDFITVSWTRFHDHFNTSLVGHSDANAAEDTGHLTVTYHHNLFSNTASGEPRVRFGSVHVFNNLYQDVTDYAIASQMNAQVIVEKNVFQNVKVPITNQHEVSATSFAGQVQDIGNSYTAMTGDNVIVPPPGAVFTFTPPYPYMTDSTATVPAIVGACAGPGKL